MNQKQLNKQKQAKIEEEKKQKELERLEKLKASRKAPIADEAAQAEKKVLNKFKDKEVKIDESLIKNVDGLVR